MYFFFSFSFFKNKYAIVILIKFANKKTINKQINKICMVLDFQASTMFFFNQKKKYYCYFLFDVNEWIYLQILHPHQSTQPSLGSILLKACDAFIQMVRVSMFDPTCKHDIDPTRNFIGQGWALASLDYKWVNQKATR